MSHASETAASAILSPASPSSSPPSATTADRYFPLLLLLFAGSGCAALIYEVVWYQLLQLAIGSTAVSM